MNKIITNNNTFLPVIIATVVLMTLIIIPLNKTIDENNGHIIYCLDDAYIHLAIAKNFSQEGVFGVTKYEFTPSSSSPLWTLLLSFFFFIFGVNEVIPLILNIFFATILLFILNKFLTDKLYSPIIKAIILTSFILFIPLPYLIFTGLEHILQIIFITLFIIGISKISMDDASISFPYYIYIVAFLSVSTRYESLFLVFSFALYLIIKKSFKKAFLIILSGSLPVIIYGIISLSKGWYFIPNSILLKGNKFNIFSIRSVSLFLYNGLRQLVYNIHLLVLFIIIIIMFLIIIKKYQDLSKKLFLPIYLFFMVSISHLLFAKTGLFISINFQIRYDSYLLAFGMVIIFTFPIRNIFNEYKNSLYERMIFIGLIIIVLLPFSERSLKTINKISNASSNTFSNQYLTGMFVKRYYNGESLLLNDIGGVNFLSEIKCLDILGLSSIEPAKLFLKGTMETKKIEQLSLKYKNKIAIVNDSLLSIYGGVPKNWFIVAQWKLKKSVISPLNTISFYACNKNEIFRLSKSMKEFTKHIPNTLYFRIIR